jgi:hypothetical protein
MSDESDSFMSKRLFTAKHNPVSVHVESRRRSPRTETTAFESVRYGSNENPESGDGRAVERYLL